MADRATIFTCFFPSIAPEFDKPLQNRTVVRGKKVLLKCYASGNPKPEVTWYRNGKAIRNKSGPFSIIER